MTQEKLQNEFSIRYYNISRKAYWLKGKFRPKTSHDDVVTFMVKHPIIAPFADFSVEKVILRCKQRCRLNNQELSQVVKEIEETLRFYSTNRDRGYHTLIEDQFGGLSVPRTITQLFIESKRGEISMDSKNVLRLEGFQNLQIGDAIDLSFSINEFPNGKYLVRDKITRIVDEGLIINITIEEWDLTSIEE